MMRRWIIGLLVLVFAAPAFGLDASRGLTQYAHRIWQATQGLPEGTIYSVCQTSDGYLWLGTLRGLVRFDGVRFTRMESIGRIPLGDVPVLDIAEDASGTMWLATDGRGVIGVKDGVGQRVEGLPTERVLSLFADSKGGLWMGMLEGLARREAGTSKVTVMEQGPDGVRGVRAMCEDRDGRIWVGGDSTKISVWDGKNFRVQDMPLLPVGGTVQALETDAEGNVWAGTSAGLIRVDGSDRISSGQGLPDDYIWCMQRGKDGSLWVGTRGGFSRIRLSPELKVESYHGRDGLSQSTVYGMLEDREGTLWVATKHGLDQFFDGRTIPVTTREGLPSNDAGPVMQDRHGVVWVGTLGAGLCRYDGKEFTAVNEELPSKVILSLEEGADDEIWVGTDKGLARMREGRVEEMFLTDVPDVPGVAVPSLLWDSKGVLWVGTSQGLMVMRDGKLEPTEIRGGVVALVQRGDQVVVGTDDGGVAALGDKGLQDIVRGGMGMRVADALYQDAKGYLWIGTLGGGLQMFDGKQTFWFSVRDGLFDDEIFSIAGDGPDRMWLACSKGFFTVSRADLLAIAKGQKRELVSMQFSATDALRTIECQSSVEPASFVMSDGRVWFSTTRGVVIVDPSRLPRKLTPPRVVVEEIAVDGRITDASAIAGLPAGRKNLSFRYTGLSFVTPSRIRFRYQLEGFDKSWVDAGNRREAIYTNLPPGNYKFRVQAHNNEGGWEDPAIQTAGVEFALAPAWYQHVWFIPLCVIGALTLLALGFQMRVRALRRRMQLVLAERSRIARELHDTLLQGFAGVTMEMQALSVRLPGESGERRTLDEIIRDAAVCLKEARRSVAGLRDRMNATGGGGFAGVMEAAAREIAAESGVEIVMRGGGVEKVKLPGSVEFTLMRIAREAVTNAVKHAQAKRITIGLTVEHPDQLVMEIADDGVGFVLEAARGPGHYGLMGMRERAEEIGAEFEMESAEGKGTVVRVRLGLHTGSGRGAMEKTASMTE